MHNLLRPLSRRSTSCLAVVATLAVFAWCPASAPAREVTITSFDGTQIAASFYSARGGRKAPTVLLSHGFGNTRQQQGSDQNGDVKGLVDAGYNALTWDARGFGMSEGTVELNDPAIEGRDVQALIDFVVQQPEALLDAPGDPRLGMKGFSYAGDIQIVAAAIDKRIDAIAPAWKWHTLVEAFYLDGAFKGGWGAGVIGLGQTSEVYSGGINPHLRNFVLDGLTTGHPKPQDIAFLRARDRKRLLERITVPTLVLQSTVDTLYPPEHAALNYEVLRRRGVPVKMMWFCIKGSTSGHGVCPAGSDDDARHRNAEIAWFNRYLMKNASVKTGPGFEWVADDGRWYSAADYPLAAEAPIRATGRGTLTLTPGLQSGAAIAATPSAQALKVAIPAPRRTATVVGRPRLRMTYRGTADRAQTVVYAQVVDTARNVVIGNQATPVPLLLDGKQHTVARSLATIAARAVPGSRFELQLASSSSVWSPQRSQGSFEASRIEMALPVGDPARTVRQPAARRCLSRRSPIGRRNIGRVRLGYTRARLLRVPVRPVRRTRYSYRYCVKGRSGRVSAVFSRRSRRGRLVLVATTARGYGNRNVRVRSSASRFRRAYRGRQRIGRGLYRASPHSKRLIGVRRGRVRFIAVANRRLLRNRRALRRALRRAGL